MIRLLIVIALAAQVVACVSTTTGPPKPVADAEEAANYNYQLGARYFRNGQTELARDRLLKSIEYDDKRAITWYTLGLTYEALENRRLATDAYRQAVRVEPRSYDALNAYAVFLCRSNEHDEGAKQFERAAKIVENDRSEVPLTNAGVCMAQKPDPARAEEYFRRALEDKPNHSEALLQLAVLKFGNKDFLSARAFLERYLSRNPASSALLFLGYRIEDELGDEDAKRAYADRLIREFPTSPETRQVLEDD